MKKNLISILILALLFVNVVLTSILMFSVTGTAKKTAALVTNIASVLNIELDKETEEGEEVVLLADSVALDVQDNKTPIPLKMGADNTQHYCLVSVTIHMNKKHEDYETFSVSVSEQLSLFQSIVTDVVSGYTLEQAQTDRESMKNEILSKIQEAYGSTFVYKVTFGNIMFQ